MKAKINYLVDMGMAISFIAAFMTGLIKWQGLIRLFGLRHKLLPMEAITLLHDWSGVLLGVLVLVHLILHWRWMVCMTKSLFKGPQKC